MTETYLEKLIRCKRQRKEALIFWLTFPEPTYNMIARKYGCSNTYAHEMIYKAKIENPEIVERCDDYDPSTT